MENGIDDLLKPINTNFLNLDYFFILFQNPVSEKEKKKSNNKYNEPNDPFIGSLLKNSQKRFQLSQQSREKRKKLNDNDDEIFNTISNRFDNVPYYELFK